MKEISYLFSVLLAATLLTSCNDDSNVKLKKTCFLDGSVCASLPDNFIPLPYNIFRNHFPDGQLPQEAWGTREGDVSFSLRLMAPKKKDPQKCIDQVLAEILAETYVFKPEITSTGINDMNVTRLKVTLPGLDGFETTTAYQLQYYKGKILVLTSMVPVDKLDVYKQLIDQTLNSVSYTSE